MKDEKETALTCIEDAKTHNLEEAIRLLSKGRRASKYKDEIQKLKNACKLLDSIVEDIHIIDSMSVKLDVDKCKKCPSMGKSKSCTYARQMKYRKKHAKVIESKPVSVSLFY